MRSQEDPDTGLGIFNSYEGTMGILGMPGSGTGPHCDRHNAFNLLASVGLAFKLAKETSALGGWQRLLQAACAVWVCVSPACGRQLHEFLQELGFPLGLQTPFHFSREEWTAAVPDLAKVLEFQRKCGNGAHGSANVIILLQEPGHLVSIPPGWYHWVLNLRPNIKVAWDPTEPKRMHEYLVVWRDIVCGRIGPAMPADYTSTLDAFVEAVSNANLH